MARLSIALLVFLSLGCDARRPVEESEGLTCVSGAPGTGPPIADVSVVGITPAPSFRDSGVVTFALLPRDAGGYPVTEGYLDVEIAIGAPAGAAADLQACALKKPSEHERLITALDLDSSGSMLDNDPTGLRKEAAKAFIDQLGAEDVVGVFDFGAGSTPPFERTRLLSDFTDEKGAAKAAVEMVLAEGGTPLFSSVVELLDYFDGEYGAGGYRRSVLVMSDGNGSGTLEAACRAAADTGIVVHTLGFGPTADKSPSADHEAVERLRSLASCGRGRYIGVQVAGELTAVFTDIGQAAKAGSVLVTVKLSPVPAELITVEGSIAVGNGAQQLASTAFSFAAP